MLALVVLAVGAAGWRWTESRSLAAALPPLPARGDGPLTVAATGDTLFVRPLTAVEAHGASSLVALLGRADIAVTNLETTLLSREHVPETIAGMPRHPFATAGRRHAPSAGHQPGVAREQPRGDYGASGILETRRILDSHRVQARWVGREPERRARGGACRRGAATYCDGRRSTSASIESRAASNWAGVNALLLHRRHHGRSGDVRHVEELRHGSAAAAIH